MPANRPPGPRQQDQARAVTRLFMQATGLLEQAHEIATAGQSSKAGLTRSAALATQLAEAARTCSASPPRSAGASGKPRPRTHPTGNK